MDLYKYINKWFVYPLYYFRSGDKRLARLKILESNQYLNKKKIDDLTFKNVKEYDMRPIHTNGPKERH